MRSVEKCRITYPVDGICYDTRARAHDRADKNTSGEPQPARESQPILRAWGSTFRAKAQPPDARRAATQPAAATGQQSTKKGSPQRKQ